MLASKLNQVKNEFKNKNNNGDTYSFNNLHKFWATGPTVYKLHV